MFVKAKDSGILRGDLIVNVDGTDTKGLSPEEVAAIIRYVRVCVYVCMYLCVCVCMYVCIYVCMVCTYVCAYVFVCVYVRMYGKRILIN